LTGLGVLLVSLAVAGAANGLTAKPGVDEAVLALGEPETLPIEVEPTPDGGPTQVAWSAPELGLDGNRTVEEDISRVNVSLRSNAIGFADIEIRVSQGNETVRASLPGASLPRIEANARGVSSSPGQTAHVYLPGSPAYELHLTSHSPLPFSTNLSLKTGNTQASLSPNETAVVRDRITDRPTQTRAPVLLNLGDHTVRPLGPEAKDQVRRPTIRVHHDPGVVPVLDARGAQDQLRANVTLLAMGTSGTFDGEVRIAPAGPPTACTRTETVGVTGEIGPNRSLSRSTSADWPCQAPGAVRVRGSLSSLAAPIEPVTQRIDREPAAPNASLPTAIDTNTELPTREGWRTLLWPRIDGESSRLPGPNVPADAFTDPDGTPARAGEFAMWMISDDAAANLGQVTVDGAPSGLVAALGPLALLAALVPLTRYP
jgi:hypothetical protein